MYLSLLLGVLGAGRCHDAKLAAIPDMWKDSSNSELLCAAILMAQHTDVWAQVRWLGQISPKDDRGATMSRSDERLSLTTMRLEEV